MAGERVIIETREGNLVLVAERPEGRQLFGCLAGSLDTKALREDESGNGEADWAPSL